MKLEKGTRRTKQTSGGRSKTSRRNGEWKLPESLWRRIMASYESGHDDTVVARLHNIDVAVFQNWLSDGRQELENHRDDVLFWTRERTEEDLKHLGKLGFVLAIENSKACWESSMMLAINNAVVDDKNAGTALRVLEARFPQRFYKSRKDSASEGFTSPKIAMPDNGRDS